MGTAAAVPIAVNISSVPVYKLKNAIMNNDIESLAALLATEAQINDEDRNGWTALHIAASRGNDSIVSLLLNHGANINLKNSIGWTPLMDAAGNGRESTVLLLLVRGAQYHLKNNYGQTAIDLAKKKNKQGAVKLIKKIYRKARERGISPS